jgi:hypothetical protein
MAITPEPTAGVVHLPRAIKAGVSKQRPYAMRDSGRIQPVARGIYVRADNDELATRTS